MCAGHTVVTVLPAAQDPLLERTLGQHFPVAGPCGRAQPSLHEGQGGKKVLLGSSDAPPGAGALDGRLAGLGWSCVPGALLVVGD